MKLIIQIPCYNEAESLPATLRQLPEEVEGFDAVETLVIDDGSVDGTAEVARREGADHVIRLSPNRGLATAFVAGLEACLERGADVIVNTDADNQYCADDIPRLARPILEGRAEMVVGARPIDSIEHFSWTKKQLQRLGTWVTQKLSDTDVQDAPSGFRAISREVARRLQVFNSYTYTLETIIQAGREGIPVLSVPVRVNGETRPSRLVRSVGSYVKRSALTLFRFFVVYKPMRFFGYLAALVFGIGFAIGLRFLIFYIGGYGEGHVQSLILAALLMGSGLLLAVVAMLADLVSVNRRLLEKINWRLGKLEDDLKRPRQTHESQRFQDF